MPNHLSGGGRNRKVLGGNRMPTEKHSCLACFWLVLTMSHYATDPTQV